MSNVTLGYGDPVSSAIFWNKKATSLVSQYKASGLGSGRYAQLGMMESELNRYITKVGRPLLTKTVEGHALLVTYDELALLEASERSIASQNVINRAKTAEAKKKAEAQQRLAKTKAEARREASRDFTPRIDTGRDLYNPPKVGYMDTGLLKGGLSMPVMLGIGAAIVGAFFLFKG